MAFTDEDLARWKNMTPGSRIPPFSEFRALLARLEAAEKLAERFQDTTPEETDWVNEWAKAAGRWGLTNG